VNESDLGKSGSMGVGESLGGDVDGSGNGNGLDSAVADGPMPGGVSVDLDAIAYRMRHIDALTEKRLLLGYIRKDRDYVLNPTRDENGRRIALLSQDDHVIVLAND